jgi:hypothetical protein
MNHALLPAPIFRPGHLLRLWTAVLLATAGYCELSQLTQSRHPVELTITLLWSVKVWTVWVGLSVWLASDRGRVTLAALWRRPVHRGALLVLLPVLALTCEWFVGAAFSRAGWLSGDGSPWELLYRRLPLYVSALGVLAYILRHMRQFSPPPVIARQAAELERFIVATSRGPVDIPVRDIEAIVAAENYVEICLTNGKQYLHRATLTSMHHTLGSAGLRRVHRSALVNPTHVVERLPHGRLRLRSGRIVRVGRSFRTALH